MANKKTVETLAKEYDFNDSTEYYNYILDSVINGQRQQARNLIEAMRKGDKKQAIVYFEDILISWDLSNEQPYEEVKKMLIDSI